MIRLGYWSLGVKVLPLVIEGGYESHVRPSQIGKKMTPML